MTNSLEQDFDRLFMGKNTSRKSMIEITSQLTTFMLQQHPFEKEENVVLVPILRGGLPMWQGAVSFFDNPQSCFILATRSLETNSIEFSFKNIEEVVENQTIILLDTIIATGITIEKVTELITSTFKRSNRLVLCSCYASPEALEKIKDLNIYDDIIVYRKSESVDALGYLIPPTHGDIGKKMFG